MGWFTSEKMFSTSQQIREALFKIRSLDYKERPKVFEKLRAELDAGGVTEEEFKLAVRELRNDLEISEVDKKNLLELLKED